MAIPRKDHIEEIHDIAMEESVGEVAEDSADEERGAEAGGGVEETSSPGHHGEDEERDRGEGNKKASQRWLTGLRDVLGDYSTRLAQRSYSSASSMRTLTMSPGLRPVSPFR